MSRVQSIASAAVVIGFLISTGVTTAQKPVPVSQLTVDVLALKSGRVVRGAIIDAGSHGPLTVAVSRDWLQHANPDLFQKAITKEADSQREVQEQLRDRLQQQLAMPAQEPRLTLFLRQQLQKTEAALAPKTTAKPSQFVWVELEQHSISKITRPTADRQRIAMWAWSESLANVETRDVHDLQRELKERLIDGAATPPDISDRLPPRPQDEREWSARLAVVEFTYAKSLEFQGTSDLLVRVDGENQSVDLAQVLSKVLKSQADSLIKELLGDRPAAPADKREWLNSAIQEAEKTGVRGFRATRVDVPPDGQRATVEILFVARVSNEKWEIVWSHREIQDAAKPRADLEARIADDPQVKKALETFKSLGVGLDDQVRQAIRFGAATMAAQETANARFFEFRDRYTRQLAGPPLTILK